MSIIVGCLPTLKPLYDRAGGCVMRRIKKKNVANSEESHDLNEIHKGSNNIMLTTEVCIETSSASSGQEQYECKIGDQV